VPLGATILIIPVAVNEFSYVIYGFCWKVFQHIGCYSGYSCGCIIFHFIFNFFVGGGGLDVLEGGVVDVERVNIIQDSLVDLNIAPIENILEMGLCRIGISLVGGCSFASGILELLWNYLFEVARVTLGYFSHDGSCLLRRYSRVGAGALI
jgi:hypothetical protein